MAELYPWFVFIHIVGLVLFAMGHGVAAVMAFRVRAVPQARAVAGALQAGSIALGPMYIGLVLLIVGGLGAAAGANLWGEPWIIASMVVLVVVIAIMYSVATPYYGRLRDAVGLRAPKGQTPQVTVTDEELAQMLDTRRPEVLMAVGGIGLLVLLWLMVLKPG